ncbi:MULTISPECIES: HPP family protein [Rhodomicrobium]|uniref:HPP family protein n=1 Tax=Rhodomicrobium TaxID=1068 RepID=UPI000B4C1A52|nr:MULTISPECIES: HPP family protein [Rhodomicrobium]
MDRKALAHTLISAACGGFGIAAMLTLAALSGTPLGAIPFATSIVLVAGAPRSPPARSKAVIFGHLICASAGIALHYSGFEGIATVAAVVALSIALMLVFDVFHPPAGITPLVIYNSSLDWTFLFMPVLAGALCVMLLARTSERLQAMAGAGQGAQR